MAVELISSAPERRLVDLPACLLCGRWSLDRVCVVCVYGVRGANSAYQMNSALTAAV